MSTFIQLQREVARNLRLLGQDETTILESRVTQAGIQNAINRIYRDELCQMLMDKYPQDFIDTTTPINTYTASGDVDSVATTTLTSQASMFYTAHVGFKVQNATKGESIEIASYTSDTVVELASEPAQTWDSGDDIYVLGNEWAFGNEAADLKELWRVAIKYSSTDQDWSFSKLRRYDDLVRYGNETFSKVNPEHYLTSLNISGAPVRGFGIEPFPDAYDGKLFIMYVAYPDALSNDSDTPLLSTIGLEKAIVAGATAWGFMLLGNDSDYAKWKTEYADATKIVLRSYRPRSRGGASKLRLGDHYLNVQSHAY